MGFIFSLLYICFTFISVADLLPGSRIQVILLAFTLLTSALPLLISSQFVLNRQFWLMLGFVLFALFSWVPHGWFGGAFMVWDRFVPEGIIFFLVAVNFRSAGRLNALRCALIASVIYMLVVGIQQYNTNPSESTPYVFVQSYGETMTEEGEIFALPRLRARGILEDPNQYAQFLLSVIPLLFVSKNPKKWLMLTVPIGAFFLYGVYLTHSRGGMIGLVIMIALVMRTRFKALASGVGAVIAFVALLALNFAGGRSMGIGGGSDRLMIWSDGISFVKRSPLWGIGFRGFSEELGITAHNSFLLCVAELGFIGYFLWMASIVVAMWQMNIVSKLDIKDDTEKVLSRWAAAALISLSVYLATGFFLSQTYDAQLYLLLGVCTAVATTLMEKRKLVDILPLGNRWALKSSLACVGSVLVIYVMVRLRAV